MQKILMRSFLNLHQNDKVRRARPCTRPASLSTSLPSWGCPGEAGSLVSLSEAAELSPHSHTLALLPWSTCTATAAPQKTGTLGRGLIQTPRWGAASRPESAVPPPGGWGWGTAHLVAQSRGPCPGGLRLLLGVQYLLLGKCSNHLPVGYFPETRDTHRQAASSEGGSGEAHVWGRRHHRHRFVSLGSRQLVPRPRCGCPHFTQGLPCTVLAASQMKPWQAHVPVSLLRQWAPCHLQGPTISAERKAAHREKCKG